MFVVHNPANLQGSVTAWKREISLLMSKLMVSMEPSMSPALLR